MINEMNNKANKVSRRSLITIIVPVYNSADYLDECIESITHQTYDNLEIILVDDGSQDDSLSICNRWAKQDSRIRVIHTINFGVSHARNTGIEVATGDFIGFIDSDDWIENDFYGSMLNQMEADNTDMCVSGYVREENGNSVTVLFKDKMDTLTRNQAFKEISKVDDSKRFGWEPVDKLFRRHTIANYRFNEDIHVGEDMLFITEVLLNADGVSYLPMQGYHYRIRPGSAMTSKRVTMQSSSLNAVLKVYKLSDEIDEADTREAMRKRLAIACITSLRVAIADPLANKYRKKISAGQDIIRESSKQIFKTKGLPLSLYCGGLYFMLPYSIMMAMRRIVLGLRQVEHSI